MGAVIFVCFNWVLGLDGGAIDVHGGSAGLSSPADRARMQEIRARADAVLVGAATVRDEDPSLAVGDPQRVAEREAEGRPSQPRPVVLTASGHLDAGARIFSNEEPRPMILTATAGLEEARTHADVADVVALAEGRDTVDAVVETLEERGVERLLVEGGPSVVRTFVAAGRVDEVWLTLSPRLGARVPGAVDPPVLEELPELALAEVERDGAFLFLRYERAAS